MELWIRSQDKTELKKINEIVLSVAGGNIFCNKEIFGKYETRKRALEVIDEIQKLLQPQIICKKGKIAGSFDNTIIREADGFEIKELSTYVYEMPEE